MTTALPRVEGVPEAHIKTIFGGKPVTEPAVVFGTMEYYVPMEEIPERFKDQDMLYARIAAAWFYGWDLPEGEVNVREGVNMEEMNRRIQASLTTRGSQHQHKMAMVAYMMWLCAPEANA